MLTIKVCPALAVMPQVGLLVVSVLVCLAVNSWHDCTEVGKKVGSAVGTADG